MAVLKQTSFGLMLATMLVLASCKSIVVGTQPALTAPALQPTPATQDNTDLANILAAKKIVVGTSANYVPFSFHASDFKLDGFDIALIKNMGKRLGVEVEIKDFAFDGLQAALQLKQVDVLISGLSITPQREQIMDFTQPYYVGEDAILARRDSPISLVRSASDMPGHSIGVQSGTVFETWLNEALIATGLLPRTSLHVYPSAIATLSALVGKEVDLVVMDYLPAQSAVRKSAIKMVGRGLNTQRFGIAVRKGSTLLAALDKTLAAAQQDGTLSELNQIYLQLGSTDTAAIPTALAPAVTPAPVATANLSTTLPVVAACLDGMSFVADNNLDDQDMTAPPIMQPGQTFQKGWRVRNSGNCDWSANYTFAFVSGNVPAAQMSGAGVRVSKQVKPGETLDLKVNLAAPTTPGTYQGFWMMRGDSSQLFGETVWVGIQVPGTPAPTPLPNLPDFRLRADATWVSVGQCMAIRWNVDNINAVFFGESQNQLGVGGNDARTVCPSITTTYLLRVTLKDNRIVEQPITINVVNNVPNFRGDSTSINVGQCTTLRWNVYDVRSIFFSDGASEQGVGSSDARSVCPSVTTPYRLRVIFNDGRELQQSITVNVSAWASS